jgi:hypothetical protein
MTDKLPENPHFRNLQPGKRKIRPQRGQHYHQALFILKNFPSVKAGGGPGGGRL